MAAMLLFLLLISEVSTTKAQQRNSNISLGSSLSPTKNSLWLSESGQFAFGFYAKGNGFAIGIWFARIPQKTVVWTANRDDQPLSTDVTLLLGSDGRLVLQQMQGQLIQIARANLTASSASMLNSGNFVLYSSDSKIIWQTFDVPTNTILPGQRLQAGQELVSSVSETDHASGKFRLKMQTDGNLVQYPVDSPLEEDYAYWASSTYTAGDNVTLNFDGNGKLYLLNSTGFNIKNVYEQSNVSNRAFYRMTMDVDGILRVYSHSLDQNGHWLIEWSSSNNKCDPIGLCGLNSYCALLDQDPVCSCPPGFHFIDQAQNNLGCKKSFSTDGCISNNEGRFDVQELDAITWEDNPYSILSSTTIPDCKEDCLRDCNCDVALFKDQQCRKQKLPLRFGRMPQGEQVISMVKVGTGSSGTTTSSKERKKEQRMGILISTVAFFISGLVVLAISGFLIYRYRVRKYAKISSQNDGLVEDVNLVSFTYVELEKATNGFTDEVGKGACGTVFKGVIANGRRVVAIKRLEKVVAEGEREFRNEMKVIGRTHHKNLVRLLGYCHDGTNRLLVYEYMSNGSLADFLFRSERKPSWEERTGIAVNVARGILYLHEECETQIIHCDIKPENILMDDHRRAKIADFGLAKLLMPNQTRTYTGIRGTRGYVAPEWHRNLPITVKADIYSFGITLLEIICCRRSVDMNVPDDEIVLANWVYDCFEASELDKLVQNEELDNNKLDRMVRVGLWCIQDEPSFRPSMKKVVLMLEGTVDIPAPLSPTSFLSAM